LQIFRETAHKYNFRVEDFQRAMDYFERAHRVGKLNELMEKGGQFDWEGIPELVKDKVDKK